MQFNRCIGRYGGKDSGPLVLAIGALHGNEPAGVEALREVFRMLEVEPMKNPGFRFKGTLVGFIGNLSALLTGERFLSEDLNRMWSSENIEAVRALPMSARKADQRELLALHHDLVRTIRDTNPTSVVLLDLHTTSADGGIFAIPDGSDQSLSLALGLHVPVIHGLLGGIGMTLMHYFRSGQFRKYVEGWDGPSTGIAFEGGQHEDPMSVSRCISATINCLRAAGCVHPDDVDSRHDAILKDFSQKLPRQLQLVYVHKIKPSDDFRMVNGYSNFQPIRKGQHLADSATGPVCAECDGRILMPLYQKRGGDGFFVVKEV